MLLSLPSKLVFTMAKQIHKVILEDLVRIFMFLAHRKNFHKNIILKTKTDTQLLLFFSPCFAIIHVYHNKTFTKGRHLLKRQKRQISRSLAFTNALSFIIIYTIKLKETFQFQCLLVSCA